MGKKKKGEKKEKSARIIRGNTETRICTVALENIY